MNVTVIERYPYAKAMSLVATGGARTIPRTYNEKNKTIEVLVNKCEEHELITELRKKIAKLEAENKKLEAELEAMNRIERAMWETIDSVWCNGSEGNKKLESWFAYDEEDLKGLEC